MVKLGIIKEDNIMSDNTNNGFPVPEEPLTREEQYLSAIAGVTEATEIPEMPLTRVEAYLNKIVEDGGDITDKLEAGTNIVIEETADGKAKISASGEVSSEDTYARGEIQAILDGTTIDSFGDVEIALADKVDKVEGKGLSANDFTDTLKTKLDGIAAGAEVNVQADWNQTTDTADDYIKNKPTIPAAQVNSDWNAASGVAQILNKPTLGTAAAAATTDFATAAQGTKADSAIQGVKVGSTTLTPDSGKAVTITKNDITGLGIPAQDTTYVFEGTYNASTNKAATMADIKDGVLTGYAQSSGNVAATDKVIEAIGKVEKKADTNESNISSVTTPIIGGITWESSYTPDEQNVYIRQYGHIVVGTVGALFVTHPLPTTTNVLIGTFTGVNEPKNAFSWTGYMADTLFDVPTAYTSCGIINNKLYVRTGASKGYYLKFDFVYCTADPT